MAASYKVNGSTLVTVGNSPLGYASSEGVSISFESGIEEVHSDEYGPYLPAELHRNGNTAIVSLELFKYDQTVLETAMAVRYGGTNGTEGTPGTLMFNGNLYQTLSLSSPVNGRSYSFTRAILWDAQDVKLSTQLIVWRLAFRCFPNGAGVLFT